MVASIQQFPIMQLVTALESLHVRVFSVEIKFLLLRPSGADRVSKNNDNWANILGSGLVYLEEVMSGKIGLVSRVLSRCPLLLVSETKLPSETRRGEMISLVT